MFQNYFLINRDVNIIQHLNFFFCVITSIQFEDCGLFFNLILKRLHNESTLKIKNIPPNNCQFFILSFRIHVP